MIASSPSSADPISRSRPPSPSHFTPHTIGWRGSDSPATNWPNNTTILRALGPFPGSRGSFTRRANFFGPIIRRGPLTWKMITFQQLPSKGRAVIRSAASHLAGPPSTRRYCRFPIPLRASQARSAGHSRIVSLGNILFDIWESSPASVGKELERLAGGRFE